MSAHSTNEDLTRYLAGEETARIQSHLDGCATCRQEAKRLLEMVGSARAKVESMSCDGSRWIRQRNSLRARLVSRSSRRPSWTLAAALALLLIASAFMFRTQEPRPAVTYTPPTPAMQAINDDALLSAVNDAIERDVPSALAPVQQLAYEREQAEQRSMRRN